MTNNIEKASLYLSQAEPILDQTNNPIVKINTFHNLGILNNRSHRPDVAINYFENAFKLAKNIGAIKLAGSALNSISGIQFSNRNYVQAAQSMDKAIYYLKRSNDFVGVFKCQKRLSEIFWASNNIILYQKSLRSLKETLKLLKAQNNINK